MYEDSVSSGSSGRRAAIRALSRAPSNSTFTMSSRSSSSSSSSKENNLPPSSASKRHQFSSRFTRPQKPKSVSQTPIVPAGVALLRERAEREAMHNTNPTDTQQSTFDIPPVPGFSELINGTYGDGTPVFSNHTKPSRFSSSRFQRSTSQQANIRVSHRSDVEAVNVPEEEQAIVLSLKVLRDKVNQLENSRTEQDIYVMELEEKVRALEIDNSSLKRRYRTDSAVGLDDGDSDDTQGSAIGERTLTVQKNRLERNLRVVSRQFEEANRKVSISETTMKSVAEERDQAVKQLGLAFVQQEKLKYDNNRLRQTNQDLAADLAQVTQHMARLKELTVHRVQNASPPGVDVYEYLFGKETDNATSPPPSAEAQKTASATHQRSVSPPKARKNLARDGSTNHKINQSRHGLEDRSESAIIDDPRDFNEDTGIIQIPRLFPRTNDEGNTQSTDVTMPKESEVADLRSKLEYKRKVGERTLPRPRSSSASEAEKLERRKASEDLRRRIAETRERWARAREARLSRAEQTKEGIPTTENDTQNSTKTSIGTRHRRIVSDPTGERPKAKDVESEEEYDSGQLFYDIAMEMTQSSNSSKSDETQMKPILKAPTAKPILVSDRKRVSFDGEEPTVRPSQAPAAALVDVIRSLTDELTTLNLEREAVQKEYDGLDPALARRQHQRAYQNIQTLARLVNTKRKQIYDCFDVLESQKAQHQ